MAGGVAAGVQPMLGEFTMRFLVAALACALLWPAGFALAQTPPAPTDTQYQLTFTAGNQYDFNEDHGFPEFEPQTTSASIEARATRGRWSVSYRRSESDDDGSGDRLNVGFKQSDCFSDFRRRQTSADASGGLACSFGLAWDNNDGDETVTASARVSGEMDWRFVQPEWRVTGEIVNGDVEDRIVSGSLELPFDEWVDNFTFRAQAGAKYYFDADEFKPTWGIGIEYDVTPDDVTPSVDLAIAYSSRPFFDDADELDYERAATFTIKVGF